MKMEAILSYLNDSPTVRLLGADQGAFVLFFLQQSLKSTGDDSAISLSHDELRHRLQSFQEQLHADEHEVLTGSADRYLREWSDAGWLRRFLPADAAGPHYQLTRYAEDAIRFVDSALSRQNRLVGTESRLRLIIETLLDIVQGSSSDPDRKVKELLAQRERIETEIAAIRGGAPVETYHPAQIRERFHTAVDLLKTLQGDFRAVEDRFEEIARGVTRDALDQERYRGEILASALDAEDLIKQQDEGVSFDAFVSFLFSPQDQLRLRETIAEVTRLDAIAAEHGAIEHVRAMVPSLLAEADSVLRQTGRLSMTLRRLLDDHSTGHRRRIAEVLRDIRTLAAKLSHAAKEIDTPIPSGIGLQVETSAGVQSPFTRPFWSPSPVFDVAPEIRVIDLETAQREARKLARLQRLDWDRMRDWIAKRTQERGSVRLSELLSGRPAKIGVIELVGWIQIAHEDGHRIDREAMEDVSVAMHDPVAGHQGRIRVEIPLVTFLPSHHRDRQPTGNSKPR